MPAISGSRAALIGVFTALVGFVLFLMIEVGYGQIIKTYITDQYGNNSGYLGIVILGGLFISPIIAALAGYSSSESLSRTHVFLALVVAFIVNFGIWAIIGYLWVDPVVLEPYTFGEKIWFWYRVIAYIAVYRFNNITLLWILTGVSFSILYAIFLYSFRTPMQRTIGSHRISKLTKAAKKNSKGVWH